jgi:hypothetical protein
MSLEVCLVVEYRYNRCRATRSRVWRLEGYLAIQDPLVGPPGELNFGDDGKVVSVYMAVPCSSRGEIDEETLAEYEELADTRFKQLRPDAELVISRQFRVEARH